MNATQVILSDRGGEYEVVVRYAWQGGRKPSVKELRASYARELRRWADRLEGNDAWHRGGDSVGKATRADSLLLGKEDA